MLVVCQPRPLGLSLIMKANNLFILNLCLNRLLNVLNQPLLGLYLIVHQPVRHVLLTHAPLLAMESKHIVFQALDHAHLGDVPQLLVHHSVVFKLEFALLYLLNELVCLAAGGVFG